MNLNHLYKTGDIVQPLANPERLFLIESLCNESNLYNVKVIKIDAKGDYKKGHSYTIHLGGENNTNVHCLSKLFIDGNDLK